MVEEGPRGLGGWLILVQIILIYFLLNSIIGTITILIGFFSGLDKSFFTFTLSLQPLILVALGGYALVLLYKKKRLFPTFFLIFFWVELMRGIYGLLGTLSLFSYFGTLNLPDFLFLISYLFFLGILILITIYMIKSKRVKNTFVN